MSDVSDAYEGKQQRRDARIRAEVEQAARDVSFYDHFVSTGNDPYEAAARMEGCSPEEITEARWDGAVLSYKKPVVIDQIEIELVYTVRKANDS